MSYRVFVDDNAHYMDEEDRYELGSFPTAEAAIEAARQIVDSYLISTFRAGMTSEQLFSSYTSFGEDPFIVGYDAKKVAFSAWDYARQRCKELCATATDGGQVKDG